MLFRSLVGNLTGSEGGLEERPKRIFGDGESEAEMEASERCEMGVNEHQPRPFGLSILSLILEPAPWKFQSTNMV